MTRTPNTDVNSSSPNGLGNYVDTFDDALKVPHLEVTLAHNTPLNNIEDTLAEACCGLLLGEKPPVFVDRKHFVAVIPVPADRVERVLYKSYILHKPSGARYPCKFHEPSTDHATQKKITIELEGAKFAWLKAQARIRERLYSYEPLIRVNWQQCTGAEKCKIHLHYSSDADTLKQELENLKVWLLGVAADIHVRTFPIYVPPRNRFGLSSDAKFREIAYTHGVSLWTRTMKDSPLGNEWCTLATDDGQQMEATLAAYTEFGQTTKWGAKMPTTSNSATTVPSPVSLSPPDAPHSPLRAQVPGGELSAALTPASAATPPAASLAASSPASPLPTSPRERAGVAPASLAPSSAAVPLPAAALSRGLFGAGSTGDASAPESALYPPGLSTTEHVSRPFPANAPIYQPSRAYLQAMPPAGAYSHYLTNPSLDPWASFLGTSGSGAAFEPCDDTTAPTTANLFISAEDTRRYQFLTDSQEWRP